VKIAREAYDRSVQAVPANYRGDAGEQGEPRVR
jgi:hypothetical protein